MTDKKFPLLLVALGLIASLVSGPTSRAWAEEPQAAGPLDRGWVGVVLGSADSRDGVEVETVLRRSPAHGAGLQNGDRILAVNGEAVRTPGKLQTLLSGQPVGRQISLRVERGEENFEAAVGIRPAPDSSEVHRLHLAGFQAPELALSTLDGNPIERSAQEEQPLVLEFWATWCSVCRRVTRRLEAASAQAPDRFRVLAITSEEPSTVREHLQTRPMQLEIAIDGGARAHEAFLVNSYPLVVVIDADGTVRDVATDLDGIDALIADLLSEE